MLKVSRVLALVAERDFAVENRAGVEMVLAGDSKPESAGVL